MRQDMIAGKFGDEDELFFEIELIAADGLEILVDALFDTGFSWWLAINNQDLEALDWIYLEQQTMQTAQGNAEFDIYLGKVRIDKEDFDIPVHVGQGLSEVLLGRHMMSAQLPLITALTPKSQSDALSPLPASSGRGWGWGVFIMGNLPDIISVVKKSTVGGRYTIQHVDVGIIVTAMLDTAPFPIPNAQFPIPQSPRGKIKLDIVWSHH